MPQPSRSDVHVNKPLTQISIAYIQDQSDFISDKVFPVVPVEKQSDLYFSYAKKAWMQSQAQKRAPGTESAGSGYAIDANSNYFCDVWAVHKDIADQVRANTDQPLDADRDATMFVSRQMLMRRELQFQAKFMQAGIWTGHADFTPATLWSVAGSDPMKDIDSLKQAIKSKTGFKPNTLVLSEDVMYVLRNHAAVLDRVKYTQKGIVTEDLIAALFGLDRLFVAGAVQDVNPEGEAESIAYMYANAGLLCYVNPTPSIMQPSAGYTFSWKGLFGAGAQGNRISSFRMEHLKSDRIEGEMAYAHKQVGADLGCFLTGII